MISRLLKIKDSGLKISQSSIRNRPTPKAMADGCPQSAIRSGFTLIELLVVVAIIGILAAVILPALHKAREQALISSCAANAKQIGMMMVLYMNDWDGYVPVLLQRFATRSVETSLLSIPFRAYSGAPQLTRMLADTSTTWGPEVRDFYFEYALPKVFVCPFVRGKTGVEGWSDRGSVTVTGPYGSGSRINYLNTSVGDSYSTWMWPRIRGFIFWWGAHPYGPDHGKLKYEHLVWHSCGSMDYGGCNPDRVAIDWLMNHPRKFSGIPSMAEKVAVYCAHGEVDMTNSGRIGNYGSHAKGGKGGTNATFGDGHAEWVAGSQNSIY